MQPIASDDLRQPDAHDPSELPPLRRLRGYAFDPSLSLRLDTAAINHALFELPWEAGLVPGPCGEYLEVVDHDPASGCWYEPVDLNAVHLLAQDGLAPSEGNPQFHQQMVYAVAMTTIAGFEKALGRQAMWAPRVDTDGEGRLRERFVRRLRIYPHALRAANAWYSPVRKALLFGYFPGPVGLVFSCLSQDIVAHETTHALLDGMHRRYVEDNHPDTLAFHEAFADLVALFQHFGLPEVLRHQIASTRGDLEAPSLLGELAQQFGEATGRYGALRSALGRRDADGRWHPTVPDPARLAAAEEPHERGAVLVAAVFAAFVAVYKRRAGRVTALAAAGGARGRGEALHPQLVDALAGEAAKTAGHFLGLCIRALDYCPPFDIDFGDYLRALVTADHDLVPDDRDGYRVALIESFRRWGIVPRGLRTLSEEQLRWPLARTAHAGRDWNALAALAGELRGLVGESLYLRDREAVQRQLRSARVAAHERLQALFAGHSGPQREAVEAITGLDLAPRPGRPVPSFEVHAVTPALRVTPDGRILKQLLTTITQRRRDVPVDETDPAAGHFDFRGGCTLIFDMGGAEPALRYAITRPIGDPARLDAVRRHRLGRLGRDASQRALYFGRGFGHDEPFCLLHD